MRLTQRKLLWSWKFPEKRAEYDGETGTEILSRMSVFYVFPGKAKCFSLVLLPLSSNTCPWTCVWPPVLQVPPGDSVSVNLDGNWIFNGLSICVLYTRHWKLQGYSFYYLFVFLYYPFSFQILFSWSCSLNVWRPTKNHFCSVFGEAGIIFLFLVFDI